VWRGGAGRARPRLSARAARPRRLVLVLADLAALFFVVDVEVLVVVEVVRLGALFLFVVLFGLDALVSPRKS
jgi:hypothetical protein